MRASCVVLACALVASVTLAAAMLARADVLEYPAATDVRSVPATGVERSALIVDDAALATLPTLDVSASSLTFSYAARPASVGAEVPTPPDSIGLVVLALAGAALVIFARRSRRGA